MLGAPGVRGLGPHSLALVVLLVLALCGICSSAPSPVPAIPLTAAQKEALALRGGTGTAADTRPTLNRFEPKVGEPARPQMPTSENKVPAAQAAPARNGNAPQAQAPQVHGTPHKESEPLSSIKSGGAPDPNNVQKVTELAQKNRLLLQQCKTLRARTTDAKMKKELDNKIAELEAVWQSYCQIDNTVEAPIKVQPPKLEGAEAKMSVEEIANAKRPRAPVRFRVICEHTEVGESVILIGGHEELGAWNALAAVPMTTTNVTWPVWEATVNLPMGDICEYKYAVGVPTDFIKDQFNIVHWEGHMGNRVFKVPRKDFEIKDNYVEPETHEGNIADHVPPSFVHMGRIDSSECLLDPEYVF